MSQDTSVYPSALLPVSFQGQTLFIVEHNGEPYVPMRPIVEAIGMSWGSQRIKVKSRYESVVSEIDTTGSDGKSYAMTCLPLRKLAGWLMTIHPNKVRPELRERIVAFQNECDDVLWRYWSERHPPAALPSAEALIAERLRWSRFLVHTDPTTGHLVFSEVDPSALHLPAKAWPGFIGSPEFPRHLLPEVLAAVSERLKEGDRRAA